MAVSVYLVGGAVRDKLLGRPIKERDWVVVGATPEQMRQQGYRQVGRDFPVFLHPHTKEEYALARTERKKGSGYYGFDCDYNPSVTLEEDLTRRDLTINAIAMTSNGELIDPCHGLEDLKAKILRHVSPAFIEDPVRVLRVARFAARYHHLGFTVAKETRYIMYQMVKKGELNHLVPERVWQEWQKSLAEANPECFLKTLRSCGALQIVLPELDRLYGVPGTRTYHPEVDTGIHTCMVLEEAVKLSQDNLVRFAAVVHDLGKGVTPMGAWPSQIKHEKMGVDVIRALAERLRIPADYRKFAILASKFHLQIHGLFQMRPDTIVTTLEKADAFRKPEYFERLLLVCEADAKGSGTESANYPQATKWQEILSECRNITAQSILDKYETKLQGEEIKAALHEARVHHVKQLLA